jgi:hypothetical protein
MSIAESGANLLRKNVLIIQRHEGRPPTKKRY